MAQQTTPTTSPHWESDTQHAQLVRHDPPFGYWVRAGFGIGIGLAAGYLVLALITLIAVALLGAAVPAFF